MSKERAQARAQREAEVAARAEVTRAAQAKAADARARRERRRLVWARIRLWQHGPTFRRNRETWGALATLVLVALLVVYIVTRSVAALFGTALILIVAAPVLVKLFFDRSRK